MRYTRNVRDNVDFGPDFVVSIHVRNRRETHFIAGQYGCCGVCRLRLYCIPCGDWVGSASDNDQISSLGTGAGEWYYYDQSIWGKV